MTVLEKSNILIPLVTISYFMALSNPLSTTHKVQLQVAWLITCLTSVGQFRMFVFLVYLSN